MIGRNVPSITHFVRTVLIGCQIIILKQFSDYFRETQIFIYLFSKHFPDENKENVTVGIEQSDGYFVYCTGGLQSRL